MKLDVERCRLAMQNIRIEGRARPHLIEEAIALIQANGITALAERYLGIKNYASFGDQREDHEYGFGPKHGSIVFSIGRVERSKQVTLGADEVYLLEAYRDFSPVQRKEQEYGAQRIRSYNLCEAIRTADQLTKELKIFTDALDAASVETYVEV